MPAPPALGQPSPPISYHYYNHIKTKPISLSPTSPGRPYLTLSVCNVVNVLMKLTVMVVVVVMLVILVMMVGKRKNTTTTPLILQISQIPPQNIELDKLLLIKAATLTTTVTATTTPCIQHSPKIPSQYYLHHQNHFNTTTNPVPTTNKTLKYSTPTTITFSTLAAALTTTITFFVRVGTVMEVVLGYLR